MGNNKMSNEVEKMLLILLISFFVLLIIFSLPLKIEFMYIRENENDELEINLFLIIKGLGLRINIPYFQNYLLPFFIEIRAEINNFLLKLWPGNIELEEEITLNDITFNKFKRLLKIIFDHQQISIIFSGLNLKCNQFCWQTDFGLGDPAYTAITNGLIYSIKGIILTVLCQKVCKLKNPVIKVNPDFYQKKFKTELKGIFSLYLGNIIFTGLNLLIYRLKGEIKIWQNIRLKN